MANANVVPPDAERLVFAVDIVSFFLSKRNPHLSFEMKSDIASKASCYRSQVRQLFNENMEKMMRDLDSTQSLALRRDFAEIQARNGISSSSLIEYSRVLKDCDLAKGLDAGSFLIYWGRIALMASFFFASGCEDALDTAVELIKNSFPDNEDECTSISNKLEEAALKYASNASEGAFLFRREPAEQISSENEESSTSSTITSGSDSVSETPKMSSDSSSESLTTLVMRLNAAVMECDTSPSANTCKEVKAENLDSNGVTSSTEEITHRFQCVYNANKAIRVAFQDDEDCKNEAVAISPPKMSCLGKRPSPRKANPPDARGDESEDSETEIKKTKMDSPDSTDKQE